MLFTRGSSATPASLPADRWDLRNILAAVLSTTLGFYLLIHWGFGLTSYPRSVFIIDALLLILFLGGIRLARRIYREMGHPDREKRVLIYGAGNAGEMIPGSGPGQACGT